MNEVARFNPFGFYPVRKRHYNKDSIPARVVKTDEMKVGEIYIIYETEFAEIFYITTIKDEERGRVIRGINQDKEEMQIEAPWGHQFEGEKIERKQIPQKLMEIGYEVLDEKIQS